METDDEGLSVYSNCSTAMEPRMIEEAELSLATTNLEREIRLCCKNRQLYGCIYDPLIESAHEMQSLSSLLHRIGKVPLEECYVARIVKDIVSCLLQLHRKHIRHGEITAQNVLINSELRARLCMPRELRIVDKRELADDIRQLGILVHCLVYSREPQYDDKETYLVSKHPVIRVSREAETLVRNLLLRNWKLRPTAGAVLHDEWMKKNENIGSTLLLYPYYAPF